MIWNEDLDGKLFIDPQLAAREDGTILNGSNVGVSINDAPLLYASYHGTVWSAKNTLYSGALLVVSFTDPDLNHNMTSETTVTDQLFINGFEPIHSSVLNP